MKRFGGVLHNWSIRQWNGPSSSIQLLVLGNVSSSPEFADNEFITTSKVVVLDIHNGIVITQNSVYLLSDEQSDTTLASLRGIEASSLPRYHAA